MDAHMPRYSDKRKAAVLNKLLPPHNRIVVSVSAEESISDVTLYSWLKQCRQQGSRCRVIVTVETIGLPKPRWLL